MTDHSANPGGPVARASWWGTAAFAGTAVGAAAAPSSALKPAAFAVAVAMFVAGLGAFGWSYLKIIGRSRTEQIGVTNVYLLSGGVAPASVRRSLLLSLGVQVVVALVTASVRPYTSLAAGTLVPLYGISLCGVWAARYGSFPPRARTIRT